MAGADASQGRIIHIHLDQGGVRISPEDEHERNIAVYDLIEENIFVLPEKPGPYHLIMRSDPRHIHFDIRSPDDEPLAGFFLAMGPLGASSETTGWSARAIMKPSAPKRRRRFRRLIWGGDRSMTKVQASCGNGLKARSIWIMTHHGDCSA